VWSLGVVGCAGPAATTPGVSLEPPGGVGPAPIADAAPETPASDAQPVPPASIVPRNERAAEPADAPTPGAPGARADGRPAWWLDEPLRQGGEVVVSAEALGADLRSARRAAVDAGLERLARELGAEPATWEIRAATVRPLRAIRAPGEVNRFAGYVLIAGTP